MPFSPAYSVPGDRKAYSIGVGRIGCLILHGFLGSPASSKPLADYLSSAGVSVHCPLLPGHGELPNKLVSATRDAWLNEALEGLDSIQQMCDEIFLIGHSMGTALCAYLASTEVAIKGLIFFAPLDELPDRRLHVFRLLRYFTPWLYPLKFRELREVVAERLHEIDPSIDIEDPEIQANLPELTRVPTAAIDEMRKTISFGRRLWPRIQVPAVVFQGGQDPLARPDSARRAFDRLSSADKQFILYEDAGHELFRPFDPAHEEVWPQVLDFVHKHSSLDN